MYQCAMVLFGPAFCYSFRVMASLAPVMVWHRADLRLHDHPALLAAIAQNTTIIPVFILDPLLLSPPYSGNNRVQFLYANLAALAKHYAAIGSRLVVRFGQPEQELLILLQESRASVVYAIRSHEPIGHERDTRVATVLQNNGASLQLFDGDTIIEPGLVRTGTGTGYRVFTPFWRTWSSIPWPAPRPAPSYLSAHDIASHDIPTSNSMVALPIAGEAAAIAQMQRFLRDHGRYYAESRNLPAQDGTSMLGSYLHLGVLGPRQAAQAAADAANGEWLRQLCWRDFYRHILWDEPRLASEAFKPVWNSFPWRDYRQNNSTAASDLLAWQTGQTGYPLVDAGMRQLLTTGWMHNRVRMIVASFLTKHLLIDWRAGEAWFNQHLLDGDLAANNGGWQWTAGCGVDAAPYFRVFNPISQGEKFDPDGEYIARYLPELAALAPKERHQPSLLSRLAVNYPQPIIELAQGRERFLAVAKQHLRGAV
jgi:deoxyribodipyrimidine photo-lyase